MDIVSIENRRKILWRPTEDSEKVFATTTATAQQGKGIVLGASPGYRFINFFLLLLQQSAS